MKKILFMMILILSSFIFILKVDAKTLDLTNWTGLGFTSINSGSGFASGTTTRNMSLYFYANDASELDFGTVRYRLTVGFSSNQVNGLEIRNLTNPDNSISNNIKVTLADTNRKICGNFLCYVYYVDFVLPTFSINGTGFPLQFYKIWTVSVINNTEYTQQLYLYGYSATYDYEDSGAGNQQIIDSQNETNDKLDDFLDSDLNPSDKELPDDSGLTEYNDAEDGLTDKIDDVDMSDVSIGIDGNSSNWVWDTLTSLINSNSVVFGSFIAILSIGIIKLALGR